MRTYVEVEVDLGDIDINDLVEEVESRGFCVIESAEAADVQRAVEAARRMHEAVAVSKDQDKLMEVVREFVHYQIGRII